MEFVDMISTMNGYMAQYIADDGIVNIFKGDQYTATSEGVLNWKGEIISFGELKGRGLPEAYIEALKSEVAKLKNQ